MKKLLCLLVMIMGCFAFLVGCGEDEDPIYYNDLNDSQEVLTVVLSPDYAPYEFIKDLSKTGFNQYAGADVEVAKYIAEKLGMKLKINSAAFSVCTSEVNAGKADLGISGFSWSPTRAENFELSDTYFADGDGYQQVLIKKSDAEKYKTLEDLNKSEVKVAAQGGSLQEEIRDSYLKNCTAENFTNIDQAVELLINGKYDAIVLAEHTIDVWEVKNSQVAELGENFAVPSAGTVCVAKKGNTALIEKVNTIIAEIVEKNLYSKWMEEAKSLAEQLNIEME